MKTWVFILAFLITRIMYHCFEFDGGLSDWLYFGGNGLIQIGFFVYLSRVRQIKSLVSAGLFYSITNLAVEFLMLAGVGTIKTDLYTVILMLSMVIGYIYGTFSKNI